jgi:cell division inhibitor SulA
MSLDELIRSANLWRAGQVPPGRSVTTGFPALDALLPRRGWPYPALIELLTDFEGIGALGLCLPALANLSQQRWLIFVAPPQLLHAPVLERHGIDLQHVLLVEPEVKPKVKHVAKPSGQTASTARGARQDTPLWAFEQALRCGDCGASLAWLERLEPLHLRRLQLACEAGDSLGFLFRPARYAAEVSPAALRLLLTPATERGLCIQLLKGKRGQTTISAYVAP